MSDKRVPAGRTRFAVWDHLMQNPDQTSHEVAQALGRPAGSVDSTMHGLRLAGWVYACSRTYREGSQMPNLAYRARTRQGKVCRARALELPIREQLPVGEAPNAEAPNAELVALRAWKAAAIARFPELDVDPVVYDARQLAALAQPEFSALIASGEMDTSEFMQGIVVALRSKGLTPCA